MGIGRIAATALLGLALAAGPMPARSAGMGCAVAATGANASTCVFGSSGVPTRYVAVGISGWDISHSNGGPWQPIVAHGPEADRTTGLTIKTGEINPPLGHSVQLSVHRRGSRQNGILAAWPQPEGVEEPVVFTALGGEDAFFFPGDPATQPIARIEMWPGKPLRFLNLSTVAHGVSFTQGNDGIVQPGQSGMVPGAETLPHGIHSFVCRIHADMPGIVIVT